MASQSSFVLVCVAASAAILAFARREPARVFDASQREELAFEHGSENLGEPGDEALPPGHPPIANAEAPSATEIDPAPSSLTWKAPPRWKVSESPNTMRLATYRTPPAPGAPEGAEISVVRAGGGAEANLRRWVEQFTEAAQERRQQKTVNGFRVHLLEVSGTFAGGMGAAASAGPLRGWALRGAVIETGEDAYFFKMTGPGASVKSADAEFDALVNSIAKADTGVL